MHIVNKFLYRTIVASTLGAALTAFAGAVTAEDTVKARVNGVAIDQSLVDAYKQRRPAGRSDGEVSEDRLVEELIIQQLLANQAVSEGLDKDPAVVAELEVVRRGLLAGKALEAHLAQNPVTEEQMRAEYDKLVANMAGTEYKARHILVPTEEEGNAVVAELDAGADFAELAKSKSTGPSGKNGGELGWFGPNQMVQPFSEAVAGMEKGTYTKQPVQTQFGWHVILLEDTRDAAPPAYEDLKDRIRTLIEQRTTQAYMVSLRQDALVEK